MSDLVVVIIIVSITLYRNKLSLRTKTYFVLLVLFVAYIVDLLQYGLLSANKVVIVLISFISLIGFPQKKAIYLYILAIISFIVISWMVITGNNPMLIEAIANLDKVRSWIINLPLLIIVTTVIIIGFYKFNEAFLKFINELNQKNIQIALNEQNYREIFNSSADAIFIHDLEGEILEVNQAMRDTYGYKNEDVSQLRLSELSSNTGIYTGKEGKLKIEEVLKKGELKFDWRAKKKRRTVLVPGSPKKSAYQRC